MISGLLQSEDILAHRLRGASGRLPVNSPAMGQEDRGDGELSVLFDERQGKEEKG